MPAIHQIDRKNQLIITTWEGQAGDMEVAEALKKYQKTFQNHPSYSGYNEVINASNLTGIRLTGKGVKILGHIAASTDQMAVSSKLAIIVNSSLAYGIARMYLAYRNIGKRTHKEIRLFKKEKDAFAWVRK